MLRPHHPACLLCAGLTGLFPQSAFAEITVLEKNNALLTPLSLEIGGSIRPEFIWNNGDAPDYYKNGHDGGTRFRFGADYALNTRTSLIGYYELGIDIPHILKWDGHYDSEGKRNDQRQLYSGIKDADFGTLTFGHQYGVYYDTIGVKSDMWDNDGHASANWTGINGDYDGGERPKNTVKYTNTFGDLTLRADYLLPQDETPAGSDLRYRRHHGAGIGIDYQLQKDLTVSAAWNETRASVKSPDGQRQHYTQHYSGAALTWQPDSWYIAATATYYNNYIPSRKQQIAARYFASDGYGLESFAGYTFEINQPWLSAVQPYAAADTLRLKGDENYHANHVYLGMYTQLAYGFSFYLERTLASTSDKEPDTTWLSIYYDF